MPFYKGSRAAGFRDSIGQQDVTWPYRRVGSWPFRGPTEGKEAEVARSGAGGGTGEAVSELGDPAPTVGRVCERPQESQQVRVNIVVKVKVTKSRSVLLFVHVVKI